MFRTWHELQRDQGVLVASGLAFQGMLAIFPALMAGVSLWGLFADPVTIEPQVTPMLVLLPEDAQALVLRQLHRLASQSGGALGWGALVGLGIALWSASVGLHTLVRGVSLAYGEVKPPNVLKLRLVTLALTGALIAFLVLSFALVAVVPGWLVWTGYQSDEGAWLARVRWPILASISLAGLAALYRWAPTGHTPRWRSVFGGAALALALWLTSSWLFSTYVTGFSHHSKIYGALGGVIIFMLWLFVAAFSVLFGAEFCAQLDPEAGHKESRHKERSGRDSLAE